MSGGSDGSNKLDDPFARIAAALSEDPAPASRRPAAASGQANKRRSRPSYSDGDSLQLSGESIPQPAHESNDPALPTVIVAADPPSAFVRRSPATAPTARGRVRGGPILHNGERRISTSTVLLLLMISLLVFAGGVLMFVLSRKPASAHPLPPPVSATIP